MQDITSTLMLPAVTRAALLAQLQAGGKVVDVEAAFRGSFGPPQQWPRRGRHRRDHPEGYYHRCRHKDRHVAGKCSPGVAVLIRHLPPSLPLALPPPSPSL